MKEYILDGSENDNNDNSNNKIVIRQQEVKKKNLNYLNLIKIFISLDILFSILIIIFIILSKTALIWICFSLILLFSIILVVIIYIKLKNDKLEEERRKIEENNEKMRLEEEKRKKEEEEKRKKEEEEKRKKEEEERRKEEERLKEMKKKMIENQNKVRMKKDISNESEKEVNQKINETLEDMCIYGNIMKKEIQEEKQKNPEKFIDTSDALQKEKEDSGLFALGLISQNLEDLGIVTGIEKDISQKKEEEDASAACLQFITNGMCDKRKYDLHFDFGEKRNEELLDNEEEYEKFKNNLKLKLSKDYGIPVDKIVVTFPQKGSYRVQVIFQSDEFNNLDSNQFISKFKNDSEFKELSYLKEIHSDLVMGGCKLRKDQLDPRGNRNDGWGVGEKRGGKTYNPPIGWNGIGLKVWDKYGDNTWLGMNNSPGEWCVAYHGVGRFKSSKEVQNITKNIYVGTFKKGDNQAYKDHLDVNHKGKTVGEGVYCTPFIETALHYSGVSEVNGKKFKTVLMVRVKPNAIRYCQDQDDYWVVNGTPDEIRPYRILYKQF